MLVTLAGGGRVGPGNVSPVTVNYVSLTPATTLLTTSPGGVEDAVMLMDQITKRHRGFGFVTFQAEETVDLVCDLHYHTIKNKKVSLVTVGTMVRMCVQVEVKKAQPKDAVMSASTAALLGKRLVMLPSCPAPAPALQLAQLPLQQLQLAAPHQLQLAGGHKMQGGLASSSSARYSPYQQPLQQYQPLQYPAPQYSAAPAPSQQLDLTQLSQLSQVPQLSQLDWSQLGIISLQ